MASTSGRDSPSAALESTPRRAPGAPGGGEEEPARLNAPLGATRPVAQSGTNRAVASRPTGRSPAGADGWRLREGVGDHLGRLVVVLVRQVGVAREYSFELAAPGLGGTAGDLPGWAGSPAGSLRPVGRGNSDPGTAPAAGALAAGAPHFRVLVAMACRAAHRVLLAWCVVGLGGRVQWRGPPPRWRPVRAASAPPGAVLATAARCIEHCGLGSSGWRKGERCPGRSR